MKRIEEDERPEMIEPLYTAFYCEENVWHLAGDPRVLARATNGATVLFISNEQRACAFWNQRVSDSSSSAVVWDYHVVLVTTASGSRPQVWDLDTTLGHPIPLSEYLDGTFRHLPKELESFAPQFRLVDGQEYRASFSSDRSHMRGPDGEWIHSPPSWPAIIRAESPSFLRWTEMADGDEDVLSLRQLLLRTW